ncbi:FUSC family protein [Pantoea ananatis]|uniref:FUSC family protein n=1 Tax=Pantoea ananas TaxID=553 RepID=UPI000CF47784|nr:FUSC family protein [Pantoea ananatis]PQK73719.1 fusaric acid resistance protein [Pantoea ananatis]
MNLNGLAWGNLPWVKADRNQWRYALRNAGAMCLALSIAYGLNLDEPYWAMTSAAVVSFPTLGGVISKSLGRIVGSLLGAAAALLIAGHTLNEPWLFTLYIAGWLALCTWVANHYQNNVAYGFSLAGYTAAIIAFSCVNLTDITSLWEIAQARVCEVISGLLCAGFMMMLLPSTSDGDALIHALKQMHARLLEHATRLLQDTRDDEIRSAHETVIGQILTMNLLRIQAFWSHYRFRRQNNVLNYILHQQLRLTSVLSSLRRMLLNWPDAPEALFEVLKAIMQELAKPDCNKYRLAALLRTITPASEGDYRQRAFCQRLRYFCWMYLNVLRWIRLLEHAEADTRFQPPAVSALASESDSAEAGWSALRTFTVVVAGCAFWITTQWSSGASALTFTAIACVLYASAPSPTGSITLLLKTLLWLFAFSFVFKFGLMVQFNQLWQLLAVLFPLLLTLQLFRVQQKQRAAMWGQFIVFLGSFLAVTNPPDWDYQTFFDGNIAKICGVLLAWLAFQLLRPSSDSRRSRRHIQSLRMAFLDQLRPRPHLSQNRFESLIYHKIGQLSSSRDEKARVWLLRWGVVLLNCSHLVWQLRDWPTESAVLNQYRVRAMQDLQHVMSLRGVQHRQLDAALDALQTMTDETIRENTREAGTLAGLLWRLRCSLEQLKQAIPD